MSKQFNAETWIWVIIKNPEKNEEIVGQQDENSGVTFIPAYESKENALQCMHLLSLTPGVKHEAQAIIVEDLETYAGSSDALIYILTADGALKEKITPPPA